jgi:cation diffusion facilitator family transporter
MSCYRLLLLQWEKEWRAGCTEKITGREPITTELSETRKKKGMRAVNVGLGANTFLAFAKTGIGILGHSPALLADGINSTSDVAYGIVMWLFMRMSGKPADKDHPYGHDQMESIAAVVVGAFVVSTGIAIFWNSINAVYDMIKSDGGPGGAAVITFWMAVLTIVIKICLTVWTRTIGKQTKNSAVIALAHDHRNDVFASAAAAIGIFGGRMGYPWVDPLAGAIVSLIILHTGAQILRSSTADLMDTIPGKSLARQINTLLTPLQGVRSIEEVHAHRFGPYLVVNITIGIDGSLTVAEGDRIATRLEQVLIEEIEFLRKVHVHFHPFCSSPDIQSL